jgi:hypothetical protein
MILILSNSGDAHATEVEHHLRMRGRESIRMSPADIARSGWLSARTREHASADLFDLALASGQSTVRAQDIDAVWVRRLGRPELRQAMAERTLTSYALSEWHAVLDMMYEVLDAAWLPGRPFDLMRADMKLTQLALARKAGFRVPDTLLTSNPEEVFAFYEAHEGRVISKLPSSMLLEQKDQPFVRFTHRLLRSDLGYLASSLRHAPCLFQEQIEKKTELRVTVVGDRVFSACIDTTRNRQCLVDSRRLDIEHTPHDVYPLGPEIEKRVTQITRGAGLAYATIDFIVRPDGELVFLELNPAGQYLWIEQLTGLPISEAICDFLVGDAPASEE